MRKIKFRSWNRKEKRFQYYTLNTLLEGYGDDCVSTPEGEEPIVELIWQPVDEYAGVEDKNGTEIYERDRLQFTDRIEWYSGEVVKRRLNGQTVDEINNFIKEQPYEVRTITLPEDYNWLLSDEIQTYWEVIGNIYENPELLK